MGSVTGTVTQTAVRLQLLLICAPLPENTLLILRVRLLFEQKLPGQLASIIC